MAGYDAVLMIAFGGPERIEDVRPFLRRVLAGRPVPEERFESVVHHYALIGGRSPLGEITRRQARALEAALASSGAALPVAIGMRNSAPFIADTLRELRASGARRVLGLIMAAHEGPASHGRYREAVETALRELGGDTLALDYADGFHRHPGFIAANAGHVRAALEHLPLDARHAASLAFTAHSVPVSVATPYTSEIAESAAAVAAALGYSEFVIAYQSRSGSPRDRWLEPDVNHVIREQAARGVRAIVLCPIGFVCDHVEVLYDLDIEAAETAREAGVLLARAASANDAPAFIDALCDRVREACARAG